MAFSSSWGAKPKPRYDARPSKSVCDDMRSYHGYRLRKDERAMREWVVKEWKKRKV